MRVTWWRKGHVDVVGNADALERVDVVGYDDFGGYCTWESRVLSEGFALRDGEKDNLRRTVICNAPW